MRLFDNSRNLSARKTFKLVHERLRETNKLGKEKTADKLQQSKGKLARLRQFLFLNPNSIFLVYSILFLVILGSAIIIRSSVDIFLIRLIFLLACIPLYLITPLFIERITSKVELEWDERWSRVVGSYLSKTNNDLEQTKRNIKRAILYYSREGKGSISPLQKHQAVRRPLR